MIGLLLFAVEKKADSLPPAAAKFAIPALLLAIPASFYLLLLVTGSSFDDARRAGWLQAPPGAGEAGGGGSAGSSAAVPPPMPDDAVEYWLGPWAPFFSGRVVWAALPGCIPEWAAMVCVVCFGSLLDVAAIKMEVRAKGSGSV